jgi:hypothetical protein
VPITKTLATKSFSTLTLQFKNKKHPLLIQKSPPENIITTAKQSVFRTETLLWAEKYLWERVTASTRTTYQTGFQRFLEFTKEFGTDVRMSVRPTGWDDDHPPMAIIFSFHEAVILSFLTYLRKGMAGHKPIQPDTAFNYLSGVKFMLTNLGVETTTINNSLIIKGVKTGMFNSWRNEEGNKKLDRITMPFNLKMILKARHLFESTGLMIDRCKTTCQLHAYTTFSRLSELIPTATKGQQHYLRTKHVVFDVLSASTKKLSVVAANNIHAYPFKEIVGVHILIGQNGTKNDQHGQGHAYYYKTNKQYIHERDKYTTFCYVRTMYEWASMAKPKANDPFFSCQTSTTPWTMTPYIYAQSIKDGACYCGIIDTKNFTPKSTRVAAASAAAAANLPPYTIQSLGRWKSTAFMRYIRASTLAFEQAYKYLTDVKLQDTNTTPGFVQRLIQH